MQKRRLEDYMKVIYMLLKTKGIARGVDIAHYFGVTKPTVSAALKDMADEGYLGKLPDHSVMLTKKGLEIAERIAERHNGIYNILIGLGVDEKTASEDACKMEHVMSKESFTALLSIAENKSKTA